jgi:hypothetical protein
MRQPTGHGRHRPWSAPEKRVVEHATNRGFVRGDRVVAAGLHHAASRFVEGVLGKTEGLKG